HCSRERRLQANRAPPATRRPAPIRARRAEDAPVRARAAAFSPWVAVVSATVAPVTTLVAVWGTVVAAWTVAVVGGAGTVVGAVPHFSMGGKYCSEVLVSPTNRSGPCHGPVGEMVCGLSPVITSNWTAPHSLA